MSKIKYLISQCDTSLV